MFLNALQPILLQWWPMGKSIVVCDLKMKFRTEEKSFQSGKFQSEMIV